MNIIKLINKKKTIIFLVLLFLSLGFFQFADTSDPLSFTITVSCSDPDGDLSTCEVTLPIDPTDTGPNDGICPESCASDSCSCSFTCAAPGDWSVCGKATDAEGLTDEDCSTETIGCVNHPPVAAFSCDPESCCYAYTDSSNPILTLINSSSDPDGEDDIAFSKWKGVRPSSNCPGLCDYTVQTSGLSSGNYEISLKVIDKSNASSVATGTIEIKQDIMADFLCSMDEEGPWEDCTGFKGIQKEYIYFKDISTVSEGAEYITSRIWELDGDAFSDENEATSSVKLLERSNIIKLTVKDDAGRTDSALSTLKARLPLPTWIEIAP